MKTLQRKPQGQRGFTLIEVVIALGILAISLVVLLQAQAASLANAATSRDMTVAVLLARSKMIDIEQKLFHDGFVVGEVTDEGDFKEEGHEEIKWKYKLTEIELDLSTLSGLCGSETEGEDDSSKSTAPAGGAVGNDCQTMMSSMAGPMQSLTEEISRSIRLADLEVSWSDGLYTPKFSVHALLTREDFSAAPQQALQQALDPTNSGATNTQ